MEKITSENIFDAEKLKQFFIKLYLQGYNYIDIYNDLSYHSKQLDYLETYGTKTKSNNSFYVFCRDGSSLIFCCGEFFVSVPILNQNRINKV